MELAPRDGGTDVRLTHSGLPEDTAESHRQGWTEILKALDDLH